MIKPHGSDTLNPLYVEDDAARTALQKEADSLPSIIVSSATAANAVMLGAGYFNPLMGYMNLADALSVANTMHTTDGLFWPTPVLNLVKDASAIEGEKRVALKDPNMDGNPVVAVMDIEKVEEASEAEMTLMAEKIYGTTDNEHPGVAAFMDQGRFVISGPIQVLNYSYFETCMGPEITNRP
jgi:sulfate adenylyltransferase